MKLLDGFLLYQIIKRQLSLFFCHLQLFDICFYICMNTNIVHVNDFTSFKPISFMNDLYVNFAL